MAFLVNLLIFTVFSFFYGYVTYIEQDKNSLSTYFGSTFLSIMVSFFIILIASIIAQICSSFTIGTVFGISLPIYIIYIIVFELLQKCNRYMWL